MRRLLDRVFAATYGPLMRLADHRGLGQRREALLAEVRGDVVEIGAGSGQNLGRYPGALTSLVLVDPNPGMVRRLRSRALRARPAAHVIRGQAESLPLRDDCADFAVVTLTLCSVRDPARALAEIRRILRPGGALLLLEHVAATGGWLRVQRAVEPVQRVIGRNCHLTRDSRSLLVDAGFDVGGVVDVQFEGWPPVMSPGIQGAARPR